MIYLLYGSDTSASQKKLNEIVEEYRKKNGNLNIHKFDAEDDDLGKIKTVLQTNSLFSEKKLVVLKHVSSSSHKEALNSMLKDLKSLTDAVVLLWERQLGAKELAELKEHCSKTQEFKDLKNANQFKEATVFQLGDSFFSSPREGVRALLNLLDQGHDDFNLFSYLVNHSRTLFTVKEYSQRGQPIPSSHGIHPFVAKKAASAVRGLSSASLLGVLHNFFWEDHKIKVGLQKPKEALFRILLRN